ncbi:MAG: hypothetical protein QS721_10105 [Candidatus Endonucleobacter sp. (ex Gigantidas childressi)]|nr:hypothetical protein [Candidatus Endonucleobacter sp. (ex Gigantidas childressi)]
MDGLTPKRKNTSDNYLDSSKDQSSNANNLRGNGSNKVSKKQLKNKIITNSSDVSSADNDIVSTDLIRRNIESGTDTDYLLQGTLNETCSDGNCSDEAELNLFYDGYHKDLLSRESSGYYSDENEHSTNLTDLNESLSQKDHDNNGDYVAESGRNEGSVDVFDSMKPLDQKSAGNDSDTELNLFNDGDDKDLLSRASSGYYSDENEYSTNLTDLNESLSQKDHDNNGDYVAESGRNEGSVDVFDSMKPLDQKSAGNDSDTELNLFNDGDDKDLLSRASSGYYSDENEYSTNLTDLNESLSQKDHDNNGDYVAESGRNEGSVDVFDSGKPLDQKSAGNDSDTELKKGIGTPYRERWSKPNASDYNTKEKDSVGVESKFRLRADVKSRLEEGMIELLELKIALGFRDSRYVEVTPARADVKVYANSEVNPEVHADVDVSVDQSEVYDSNINKETKLDVRLRVNEKENIQTMIKLLMNKTKELHPYYKDFIDINLRQIFYSYAVNDDQGEMKNLYKALHLFSEKMMFEYKSNKLKQDDSGLKWSGEQYTALIDGYKILGDLVEDQFNSCKVVECKLQLKKAFHRFENRSEESFLKLKAKVGISLGVVSVDGGYEISSQIVGCDDTKIRVFKNQKGMFEVSVGSSMVKGYIASALGVIDGKVFNNLDAFIDFYADNMMLNVHSLRPGKKIKRSIIAAKKGKKHSKLVLGEMPFLQKAFKDLKLLDKNDANFKYEMKGKSSPLKIGRSVFEYRVGGEVANVAAIDLSATKWNNTFTKNIPLLQQLDSNPQWLIDYDRSCFNLSMPPSLMSGCKKYLENYYTFEGADDASVDNVSGEDVVLMMNKRLLVLEEVALNAHRKGVSLSGSVIAELDYLKDTVVSLIKINYEEYKEYCEAVNIIRFGSNKFSIKDQAKAVKSKKKKLRKAQCSADMLKKMMVSHAKLKSMYKLSIESLKHSQDKSTYDTWKKEVEYQKNYLEEISLDMSVPDIYVSGSDREKHLMLKKTLEGSIQCNAVTAKLALGPLNGVVHVRQIINKDEPNPDADGEYLYVTLRGSVSGMLAIDDNSVVSAIVKLIGTLPPMDGDSDVVIDPMAGVDTVFQTAKHFKMELFFVKGTDDKYHMQYRRYLSGEELTVSGGGKVPIAGVVFAAKAGLSKYKYHFEKEHFGCETMTYFMTRYNGWKVGNNLESWDAFTADKKTRIILAKLMVNMAKENNNANNELNDIVAGVRSYYEDKSIDIDETQVGVANGVLNDANTSDTDKHKARKVLDLNVKNNNDVSKNDRRVAGNVMQKTAENGSWETSFDELKKEYQHLMDGPLLPSLQQSDLAMKNVKDLIDATTEMSAKFKASKPKAIMVQRFLEKSAKYIDLERTRFDAHRSAMKKDDVLAMEEKIVEMESVQSQLQKQIKVKREHTAFGFMTTASWINLGSALPIASLDSLSQTLEEYKTLCPNALDGGEKGVLAHLIGTEKFEEALSSFNQLLEANHEAYLADANSRFHGVNQNKPKPYK